MLCKYFARFFHESENIFSPHPKPLLHTHPWQLIERVHREHTAPYQIHGPSADRVICREVP